MDLEAFIKWEKEIIREERERLKLIQEEVNDIERNKCEKECPASKLPKEDFNPTCNRATKNLSSPSSNGAPAFEKTRANNSSEVELTNATFSLSTSCDPECDSENAAAVLKERDGSEVLSKTAKEVANKQTAISTNNAALTGSDNVANVDAPTSAENRNHEGMDDMDQWVTDTFYSYFPGYNDELQKRQRYLRERQQENQQNLLRHKLAHPPLPKHALHKSKQFNQTDSTVNTARSSATTTASSTQASNTSSTMSHPTKKTDLEIIVNNPGYVPPKQHSSRPTTTRHKLLQDLRHTELSPNIVGDEVTERSQQSELESARKKSYQRELMQQIEEKRRSIEVLREKERHQDEALTRRLQEQLKTIQLEEQLEKEKIRAEKVRFDSEQNRLMREQLLAKLDNDRRLIDSNARNNIKTKSYDLITNKTETIPDTATTVDVAASFDADNNRVYKYFSNSARHEYRRGKPLPEELELDLGIEALKDDDEFECFHLSEKVCPMCDAPLKNYESCCLRCQKKLSLRMKSNYNKDSTNGEVIVQDECANNVCSSKEPETYTMVCEKCERLYGLCSTCVAQKEVCRACHRKRNVCLNCRRTLCTRCLDEIASGRDAEKSHVNEHADVQKLPTNKTDRESLHSFQVLEVNYGVPPENNNDSAVDCLSSKRGAINHSDTIESPPYSTNIEKNSIFHPDYVPVKQVNSLEKLDATSNDDQFNIDRVRKETDKRLSRYLRNYGDLASNPRLRSKSESGNDRSTQTTPHTAARRDIVMNEEHNLSMPLLREMPKMTRTESDRMMLRKPIHTISKRIQQLKRRWEVPAVQKFTISTSSPKVLTQVGAIRKQLQAEHIMADA